MKQLKNKIFCFDLTSDFIQCTQVITLENNIYHICLVPFKNLDPKTNEIVKLVN